MKSSMKKVLSLNIRLACMCVDDCLLSANPNVCLWIAQVLSWVIDAISPALLWLATHSEALVTLASDTAHTKFNNNSHIDEDE